MVTVIAMRLKQFRNNKRLKQREVAEYLNISRSTYNAYEQNISEPNIDTLIKLAELYRTTIDHLVGCDTKLINLLALSEEKREIFEIVLNLNDFETKKIHAFVAGFASAKNEWPPFAKKPPDIKPGHSKFNNY